MTETDDKLRSSIIRFIGSLRSMGRDKRVEETLYHEVIENIRRYKAENISSDSILKRDAAILFHLFEGTLAEANHANDPAPIIESAWDFSEEIRQALDNRS
jgi:hypothetical protein